MRRLAAFLVLSLPLLVAAAPAAAATLEVDAKSNIFGAGHAVPPGTEPGLLPPSFSFSAGAGQKLTFSSVSGLIYPCCPPPILGPEGQAIAQDISSTGGISGIVDSSRSFYLVGVFLTDAEPTDPAPARLDFSPGMLGRDFGTLSPAIGQTFFIGDGKRSAGAPQEFVVPANATRLFLGFADADVFNGPPAHYDDNVGSLSASFNVSASTPPRAWDLASDFKTAPAQANPNPDQHGNSDTWSFRQSAGLLPTFGTLCGGEGWQSVSFYPWVAKHLGNSHGCAWPDGGVGQTVVHPSTDSPAIVAWKSPISGTVSVSGRVDDWDTGGGDGVRWFINRDATGLASGEIASGGQQAFSAGSGGAALQSVTVQAGDMLYFGVDARGPGAVDADAGFDTTGLAVSITEGATGGGGGPSAAPPTVSACRLDLVKYHPNPVRAPLSDYGWTVLAHIDPMGQQTSYKMRLRLPTGTSTLGPLQTSGVSPQWVYFPGMFEPSGTPVEFTATNASGTVSRATENCPDSGPKPAIARHRHETIGGNDTIFGEFDPNGSPTVVWVQWKARYWFTWDPNWHSVRLVDRFFPTNMIFAADDTTHPIRIAPTDLLSGTMYDYRIIALSLGGSAVATGEFKTDGKLSQGVVFTEVPILVDNSKVEGIVFMRLSDKQRRAVTSARFTVGRVTRRSVKAGNLSLKIPVKKRARKGLRRAGFRKIRARLQVRVTPPKGAGKPKTYKRPVRVRL